MDLLIPLGFILVILRDNLHYKDGNRKVTSLIHFNLLEYQEEKSLDKKGGFSFFI
jgi:hypothetical protein